MPANLVLSAIFVAALLLQLVVVKERGYFSGGKRKS